ncbi:MAG: hypothetical protein ACKVOP_10465 [Sphingomonadaceae bacterium]
MVRSAAAGWGVMMNNQYGSGDTSERTLPGVSGDRSQQRDTDGSGEYNKQGGYGDQGPSGQGGDGIPPASGQGGVGPADAAGSTVGGSNELDDVDRRHEAELDDDNAATSAAAAAGPSI